MFGRHHEERVLTALLLAAVAGVPLAASGSETKLTGSDVGAFDRLGWRVAVSGDVAVLGAFFADVDGKPDQGAAYVFRFDGSTWLEEQKLTAADGAAQARFGSSVAVDGDVVLVGARFAEVDGNVAQGAAYVFRFDGSTWLEEQKLTVDDGAIGDELGSSVALSGGVAAVGAERADVTNVNQGALYVFRFDGSGFVPEQKLAASDGAQNDSLGWTLALSGDTLVAGAPFAEIAGSVRQGAAYVFGFDGSTWVEEQKLTGSDGVTEDTFGISVALSAGVALVGAIGADPGGAAYVFRRSGASFVEEQRLDAGNGAPGDRFGESVAIDHDVAVVGAPYRNARQGAAYLFRDAGAGFGEVLELAASDGDEFDEFGWSAALADRRLVLGAQKEEPGGAAYAYRIAAALPASSPAGRALIAAALALLGVLAARFRRAGWP